MWFSYAYQYGLLMHIGQASAGWHELPPAL
jgi:hypothetical protein